MAAPVAAVIGLIISSASINYAKTHDQSVSVYDKLTYVLLGLAVLILITSWLRKRLFQGITLALYGLAIFQLHYTYFGFAAPFLLAGAWYLVRAYRLQQELKRAEAAGPSTPQPKGSQGSNGAPPRPAATSATRRLPDRHPWLDGLPAVPQHQEQRDQQQQDSGQDRRQHEDARRRVLGGDDGGR